jgi:hypothetical protein
VRLNRPSSQAHRVGSAHRKATAGLQVNRQAFDFELDLLADFTPPVLSVVSGGPARSFVPGIGGTLFSEGDFGSMYGSPSGDLTAPVWAADIDLDPATAASNTSGCQAADYAGMPKGAIVLLQDSGACSLGTKFFGAQQFGAGAIFFFDAAGGTWVNVTGTSIPSVAGRLSSAAALARGVEQGATGLTARLKVDWRPGTYQTSNVIAETRDGDPNNVVVVGAHLDSVGVGPGINDNGSGSATILEIAEQMRKVKPRNKVRFIWFGAEEHGLLGSQAYVDSRPQSERDKIAAMLNSNLNRVALDQMSDAAAHATLTLAQDKRLFESGAAPGRRTGKRAADAGGHAHALKVPRGSSVQLLEDLVHERVVTALGRADLAAQAFDHVVAPLVGVQEQVAQHHQPQVAVGVGPAATQAVRARDRHDRLVVLVIPVARQLLPRDYAVAHLRLAEAHRLDQGRELGVAPFVGQADALARRRRQRNALVEQALVVLEGELVAEQLGRRGQGGPDFAHVGGDRLVAHRPRHADAMVAVLDEVQGPDPVDLDRREIDTTPARRRDVQPAAPQPPRRGPERAIEVARPAADRADDRVQRDVGDAKIGLRPAAERRDDVLEREHVHDVVGLLPQPRRDPGECVPPALAIEVAVGGGLLEGHAPRVPPFSTRASARR